jgi:hypothetical protein
MELQDIFEDTRNAPNDHNFECTLWSPADQLPADCGRKYLLGENLDPILVVLVGDHVQYLQQKLDLDLQMISLALVLIFRIILLFSLVSWTQRRKKMSMMYLQMQ